MDETEFWALVDGTRLAAGRDPDLHAELLVERLTGLDPEAVHDFARHFEARFSRAYRWDLWGAACVLLNGAGDDAFENFRCWLISQGRTVFEGALADPDALAELLPDFDERTEGEAEEIGYAAFDAYEHLTGVELPDLGLGDPGVEPQGVPIDLEDEEALAAALPELWARFGARRRAADPQGLAGGPAQV
ncbi:DUF4240 domain-containing protein [Streptomyces sp. 3MP-14]|uniref:DUF4240 domain-containing protein n=1 Tax=Streptomyces mimosae TaxID=2586635 RepID=A0A5N6AIU4_9ACTN|nr:MULTISPECIES: DUF4240 domain-containing protein [Streptomyces]KAB8168594.1 DUF4240 domain-containing protein [Streptomyces mimosae]KAB8178251.1 DUF4240 domain-containing protein [Streptomyces sp. 3MP-14]